MDATSEPKTAVITGGTRRLGKAIAAHFARRGWSLVLTYKQNRDAAEQTCAELARFAPVVRVIQCETGHAESVEAVLSDVAAHEGRLDFLLHNVGTYRPKPAEKVSVQDWERTIASNLNGGFYLAHFGLGLLRSSQGLLGFMGYSGLDSVRADPDAMDYQASKVGLLSMTKSLGVAYGPMGVRVAMVSPGQMDNSIDLPKNTDSIPISRWGKPEDICQAWDYLLQASYVTGINIDVAGGFRL